MMRPFSLSLRIFTLVLLAAVGCSSRSEQDAALPQANAPDANAPDAQVPEADVPASAQTATAPAEPATTAPPVFELDAEQLLAMRLPDEQTREGWIRLFDGHTLYGWQMTGAANWRTADGDLMVDAGEQSLLCTSLDWLDYELRLEFKAGPQTNSGIFLRTPLAPLDPAVDCYELNIAPADNPFPTGSLVGRRKVEPAELGELDPETWHTFDVRVQGGTVTVSLDGRELYSWEDPMPRPAGRIAVQHNEGPVAFRNIRLRPLGFEPLLLTAAEPAEPKDPTAAAGDEVSGEGTGPDEEDSDEADSEEADNQEANRDEAAEGAGAEQEKATDALALWKQYPEMEGKFEIDAERNLHVRGGLGQLETRAQYGDFVLLAEAKTAGPEQNSGIFFRCIPGDQLMGYECQINNDMVDGNPLRPADCGTGGFFRRQDARIVAAGNDEWFTLMLVARGPEMAAWVNGLQVSEWRDTREPNPNPRRGQRLAPGTIMLQAHDPSTDVRFRSIRIAPRDPSAPDDTSAAADATTASETSAAENAAAAEEAGA